MAVEAKQIGIYIKKGVIISVRICYRFVRDYPAVLGVVLFSVLLYRLFPSLFGLLVSSSPVIFCTAVLLGTLLSFGQPNIPEIEEEEKQTHDISSLKAGGVGDDLVVEKDESFAVETHVERRREAGLDESVISSTAHEAEKENDADSISRSVVIEGDEKVLHGESNKAVEEGEYHDHGFIEKREFHEVGEEGEGHPTDDRKKEIVGPEAEGDVVVGGTLDAHLDGHDDMSSDSDSDCAESSSPDASMADVMPMLDELHPLLGSEAPQPVLISLDDSDSESDDGSVELVGDAQNPDEAREDQKDGSEAVVTWTKDDEKNLMDLGTSELERNQRLENLIAKRIARKNRIAEAWKRNLIDLEINDSSQINFPISEEMSRIPIQVPSLSTARRNPFDPPYGSDEFAGLPPIPGSAPSVLLPRRNPFDLPFDQAHESTSNLMAENSSHNEFMALQQREMYSRRHETSTLGASFPGEIMQERHESRLRQYFVAERASSGEMDFAPIQRQWSEKSDSKVSSAPETDMVSSVVEQEVQKELLAEQILQEAGLISLAGPAIEAVERESKSSKEEDSVEIDSNVSNFVRDTQDVDASKGVEEVSCDRETSLPTEAVDTASKASPVGPNAAEALVDSEVVEENYSESSSSSSSETSEKNLEMNADEESDNLDQTGIASPKQSHKSMQETHVYGTQFKRPVYDASPLAIRKSDSNLAAIAEILFHVDKEIFNAAAAAASDTQVEILEGGLPSTTIGQSISTGNGEVGNEIASSSETRWVEAPSLSVVDEKESRSREVAEVSEWEIVQVGFSGVVQNHDDSMEPLEITESEIKEVSQGSNSLASDVIMAEVAAMADSNHRSEEAQITSSSDQEAHVERPQVDVVEKTDAVTATSDGLLLAGISTSLASQPLREETAVEPSSEGHHKESKDDDSNPNEQVHEPEDSIHSKVSPSIPAPDGDDSTVLHLLEQKSIESSRDFEMKSEELITCERPVIDEDDEAGGIKGIDEELLLELDAVGDFSIQEPKSNAIETEKQLEPDADFITDSPVDVGIRESLPQLQILQDEFVEGVGIEGSLERSTELQSAVDQPKPEVGYTQFESFDRDLELKEHSLELRVLEAKWLADIDLAFKQVHEGEVEKSVLESFMDRPITMDTEVGSAKIELAKGDADVMETGSELQVLEARSLEDIDLAFKQLHEEVHEKSVINEPQLVESEIGSSGSLPDDKHSDPTKLVVMDSELGSTEIKMAKVDADLIETGSELQVLEASSLEDIDSAFKRIHEGVREKSVVSEPQLVESVIGSSASSPDDKHLDPPKLVVMDTKVGSTEIQLEKGDADLIATGSELQVLEARSLEDIDSAFKQLPEGVHEKSVVKGPQLVESENGSSVSLLDEKHPDSPKLVVMDADVGPTEIELAKGDADLVETSSKGVHEKSVVTEPQLAESEIGSSVSLLDVKHPDSPKLVVMDADMGRTEIEPAKGNADLVETSSDLQVLEARSLEDIDSAFKQLHERDLEKSTFNGPPLVESEIGSSVSTLDDEHREPIEIHSDVQVLEARSLEDINAALKQASEENVENQPKPLETEATERHVEPVFLSQPAEVLQTDLQESVAGETSTSTEESSAGKSNGVKEVSEGLSPSAVALKEKSKKKSSGKSGSSSSSSSSSSDSD
ncbi:uncharacterized protein LOC131227377 [Magnolia sinica]|uniref:uncharacterized protein LOC131227377 n=1 Tax=Magnolia sinica TaxID=86752 RepID=UPI002659AAD3|nr:uncharacterized protein LOC131227377 [Magnolia sinica]XP_058079150.1 uncharacterized protein LOC131227377 [Magnolia sinica]XP_058079151.1 uncharacterized protein LOC131227377 [Magnolia sinica]